MLQKLWASAPDYTYQIAIKSQLGQHLVAGSPIVILAACVGAGKTRMTLELLHSEFADRRVCVLTHGQTVVRSQWKEAADALGIPVICVEPGQRVAWKKLPKKCIVIGLPQALRGKSLPKFDLAVIDEAQERYFGKEMQGVLAAVGSPQTLLLSGTAGKLKTKLKCPVVYFAMQHLIECGAASNVQIRKVSTSYEFTAGDYNAKYDLTNDAAAQRLTREATDSTLASVLDAMQEALVPETRRLLSDLSLKPFRLDLDKTLVVCRSVKQAEYVADYMRSKGYDAALSTGENDPTSAEIDRFKDQDSCRVLAVCGRAKVGFDYPDLAHVVDMSGTCNVDLVHQMLGRVSRPAAGKRKYMWKVMPESFDSYTLKLLTLVVALCHQEFYELYDGNYKDFKPLAAARKARGPRKAGPAGRKPAVLRNLPDISDLVQGLDLFTQLLYTDGGDWEVTAETSLREAMAKMRGTRDPANTKEKLLAMLRSGKPRPNRHSKDKDTARLAYKLASYMTTAPTGHYDPAFSKQIEDLDVQVFPDSVGWTGWTAAKVKQAASKYQTRTDFQKAQSSAYKSMLRLGITKEIKFPLQYRSKKEGRPVLQLDTLKIFPSVAAAAITIGTRQSTLRRSIEASRSYKGYTFRYLTDEELKDYYQQQENENAN